ncbi:hypothetical protein HDU97_001171 [Phlyctochytrium planicorne]|nr:hypothetical protein HDU97_001171 [Phlyctochytrium planicorne]
MLTAVSMQNESSNNNPVDTDGPPSYLLPSYTSADKPINELISILSENNISLPSKREKKQFYLDLFETEIVGKREKLLKEWKRLQMQMVSPTKRNALRSEELVEGRHGMGSIKTSVSPPRATRSSTRIEYEDLEPRTALRRTSSRRKDWEEADDVIVVEEEELEEVPLKKTTRTPRTTSTMSAGSNGTPIPPNVTLRRAQTPSLDNSAQTSADFSPDSSTDTIDLLAVSDDPEFLRQPASSLARLRQSAMESAAEEAAAQARRRATLADLPRPEASPKPKANTPMKAPQQPQQQTPSKFLDLSKLATPTKDVNLSAIMAASPAFVGGSRDGIEMRQTPARDIGNSLPAFGSASKGTPAAVTRQASTGIQSAFKATPASGLNQTPASAKRRSMRLSGTVAQEVEETVWDNILPGTPSRNKTPERAFGRSSPKGSPAKPVKGTVPKKRSKVSAEASWEKAPKMAVGIVVLVYALVYASLWDRVGYRNVGAGAPTRLNLVENEYFDRILARLFPLTRPCPTHATCFGKTVVSCNAPDLELKSSILTRIFGGALGEDNVAFMIPFGVADARCAPDTEKLREEAEKEGLVESLVIKLDNIVRLGVGKGLCGVSDGLAVKVRNRGKVSQRFGVPLGAARKELRRELGPKWTDDRFDEMWGLVLQRLSEPSGYVNPQTGVAKLDLPLSSLVGEGGQRLLISVNQPIMSMMCNVRLAVLEGARARWMELSVSGLVMALCTAAYFSYKSRARDAQVVSILIEDVIYSIYEETCLNAKDAMRHPVPGIIILQLRDYLLSVAVGGAKVEGASGDGMFSSRIDDVGRTLWTLPDASTRDRIWAKCVGMVQRNSCIREINMDYKGKRHPTWQWIGSPALGPKPRHGSNASSATSSTPGGSFGGVGSQRRDVKSLFSDFPVTPDRKSNTEAATSSEGMMYTRKVQTPHAAMSSKMPSSATFNQEDFAKPDSISSPGPATAAAASSSSMYPSLDDIDDSVF